ncbi:MAG: YjbQ family protein, partial [Ignavibacteriales bacterium]
MVWVQKEIKLEQRRRGFHVITDEVLRQIPELKKIKTGILHIHIKHTSASLTINENVSPDVLSDMENHFNKMVPENMPYYDHNSEGPDDMPAHI